MYKYRKPTESKLKVNQATEGEWIERKMRRIFNNKEPINDTVQSYFTERKDGVIPATDIRASKWDDMAEGMDKLSGTHREKRAAKIVEMETKNGDKKPEKEGKSGGQSTDGTGDAK